MRIFLEATKSIYVCIAVTCNFCDKDGWCQVFFKLADGLTLIVEVPAGEYERLIRPRLLKNGYYTVPEYYIHSFISTV